MAAILFAAIPGALTLSLGTAVVVQQSAPLPSWRRKILTAFTAVGAAATGIACIAGLIPLNVALIMAVGAVGYMSSDLQQGISRRQGDYVGLAHYRWIDVGGGAVLIILLGVTGNLSVEAAVGSLCLSTIIAVAYICLRAKRAPHEPAGTFSWRLVPNIHVSTLVRVATSWTDQILIAVALGAGSLGLYAIANSVASQFMVLPSAVNTVLLTSTRGSHVRGAQQLSKYFRHLLWSALGAVIALLVTGRQLFGAIFGPAFAASAQIAALLLLGYLLSGLVLLSETFLIGAGDSVSARKVRLWSIPSIALGSVIFLLWPSALSAAVIPILGNLAPLCLLLVRVRRMTRIPLLAFVAFPSDVFLSVKHAIYRKRAVQND